MAYRSYIDAKKMPRNTEDEQKIYRNVMDNAIIKCTLVPLDIAITSYKVLQEIPFLVENTIKSTVSDLGICCSQIASAIEGSYFTIKSNLSMVKDVSFKSEVEKEILSVMAKAEETKSELLKKIQTMI